MRPFKRLLLILPLLAVLALPAALRLCAPDTSPVVRSRILMGTVVEVIASGPDRKRVEKGVSAAFAEMARIEALMGPAGEESDVARLSRAAREAAVAPETAEVLAFGLEVAARSGGAFDLTLGRLKGLWGIESESPRLPSEEEIRVALEGVGPQSLRLGEGGMVTKGRPELAVDLGGIAKGYAVDRGVEVLLQAGVTSAAVNAGGDMRLHGTRDGRPWRIGIQHPRRPGEILGTLDLEEGAVVTSGDYERFFEQEGVRYHHLFDPRTGHPARRSQAVTVTAPSALLADALSTALFVLGPEEGLALLEHFPQAQALIVGADGRVHLSPGLQEKMRWR